MLLSRYAALSDIFRHALGNRARKAGQGILTVRFEMPFAIWCSTCPKETIIGQGVRFNAEKKKVGNYFSTPIYSFRMKHAACGGWIEIRTDPKNTAYVVTEGARKRDTGEDTIRDGDLQLRSEADKEKLRNDAFAALEVTIDDRQQVTIDKSRIEDLYESKDRDWDDPYAASQKIRKTFRVERKRREKNEALTEELKDRMSLGNDLLAESEGDRMRAALITFGDASTGSESEALKTSWSRRLFAGSEMPTKAELEARASKEKLRGELSQNTRNAVDPFLSSVPTMESKTIAGLKRKRRTEPVQEPQIEDELPGTSSHSTVPLVDYGSD